MCCARSVKKVHGGILICDLLLVTAAIFTSVVDVFPGIVMADASTHRIKTANLCRFCGETASSKTTPARSKARVDVEDDNYFIHPPNVCLTCLESFGQSAIAFKGKSPIF